MIQSAIKKQFPSATTTSTVTTTVTATILFVVLLLCSVNSVAAPTTSTNTIQCSVCVQSHVSSHPSANICLECGRWFKDKKILKCHTARHTSESAGGGMIMDCGMCGLEFELMVDLADHVSVHTPELMWNACLVCGRHLAPLSSMEKHLRTHTGAKMATCPICARQFAEVFTIYMWKLLQISD